MKFVLTGNSNPSPTCSFSSLKLIPIFAAPIPTGVICWAGSVEGLSLEIGSVLEFALVLTGSGVTGIATGVGSGYRALGMAAICGVKGAGVVGWMVGIFTGAGDTGGDAGGVGWLATGVGVSIGVGVGVGVTIAIGGCFRPQAVTPTIANKHRLR